MVAAVIAGVFLINYPRARAMELEYLEEVFQQSEGPKDLESWRNFGVMDADGKMHQVTDAPNSWRKLKKVPGTKNTYYMPDGTTGAIPGDAGP